MKAHEGSSEPLVLLNVHFSSLDVLTPIPTFCSNCGQTPDSRNKTPTGKLVGVGYLRLILYLFKSCNVLSNSDTSSRPL